MSKETKNRVWIPGGNSGVLLKGIPYSDGGASCIRKVMLRNEKVKEPIGFGSEVIFAIGNLVEEKLAKHLDGSVEQSVRRSADLNGGDQVYLDETDIVQDGLPIEVKTIVSSTKCKKIFGEGGYIFDHLVQAAHHMIMAKSYTGKIIYVSGIYHGFTCKKVNYKIKTGDIREVNLMFDKITGKLVVDGKPQVFGTPQLIMWRSWAGSMVDAKDFSAATPVHSSVLDPTIKRPTDFDFICNYCFWKEACDNADNYVEFVEYSRALAEG